MIGCLIDCCLKLTRIRLLKLKSEQVISLFKFFLRAPQGGFGMSYLPSSPLSTLTTSSLTFSHGLYCSHTKVLTFSEMMSSHNLWPPQLRQPHTPEQANFYCLSRLDVTSSGKSSQSPDTGWGISLGLLQFSVLTDTTTLFTLKCSCPFASPEHNLPEDKTWSSLLQHLSGVEDSKYSIYICSMHDWNTQKCLLLKQNTKGWRLAISIFKKK